MNDHFRKKRLNRLFSRKKHVKSTALKMQSRANHLLDMLTPMETNVRENAVIVSSLANQCYYQVIGNCYSVGDMLNTYAYGYQQIFPSITGLGTTFAANSITSTTQPEYSQYMVMEYGSCFAEITMINRTNAPIDVVLYELIPRNDIPYANTLDIFPNAGGTVTPISVLGTFNQDSAGIGSTAFAGTEPASTLFDINILTRYCKIKPFQYHLEPGAPRTLKRTFPRCRIPSSKLFDVGNASPNTPAVQAIKGLQRLYYLRVQGPIVTAAVTGLNPPTAIGIGPAAVGTIFKEHYEVRVMYHPKRAVNSQFLNFSTIAAPIIINDETDAIVAELMG